MKKPFIYLLTAGLAVSMIANTGTVYSAQSDATVEFTIPNTDIPVAPLDPRNPAEELENPDGTTTGEAGDLALDYVSNFEFNSVELDLSSNQPIVTNASVASPSLQVSDRRQTGEGWNVIASLSGFTDRNEDPSLQNATITLNSGTAISPIAILEGVDTSLKSPQVETPIILESNNDSIRIVEAQPRPVGGPLYEAEGLGTWITTWLAGEPEVTDIVNENVLLTVPARTATEGMHQATIDWMLTAGPYTP